MRRALKRGHIINRKLFPIPCLKLELHLKYAKYNFPNNKRKALAMFRELTGCTPMLRRRGARKVWEVEFEFTVVNQRKFAKIRNCQGGVRLSDGAGADRAY